VIAMFVEGTLAALVALVGVWRAALTGGERAMLAAKLTRRFPMLGRQPA